MSIFMDAIRGYEVNLESAEVMRSGSTESTWRVESEECKFNIVPSSGSIEFSFSIASAGGGKTDIKLKIGEEDLPTILNKILDVHSSNLVVSVESKK